MKKKILLFLLLILPSLQLIATGVCKSGNQVACAVAIVTPAITKSVDKQINQDAGPAIPGISRLEYPQGVHQ